MGTKNVPGKFDCYDRALPDEPIFTLLARDPLFYRLVMIWSNAREDDIRCGERPVSDMDLVFEARKCASLGAQWRQDNNGKWRKPVDKFETIFNASGDILTSGRIWLNHGTIELSRENAIAAQEYGWKIIGFPGDRVTVQR